MSKNEVQQGKKISGKKANSDRYIQLHEFLMFDPVYRKMSDKAKVLYAFLRSKVSYFEKKQEAFEAGEDGAKSYMDDNGDIYIIADNTELEYILNGTKPTVIAKKKELKKFGLLLEEKSFHQANRIYVLEPVKLADRWTYINEIKELRSENQKQNKKDYEKYVKNKPQEEKQQQEKSKKELLIEKYGIRNVKLMKSNKLKIFTYDKLNNFTYNKLSFFTQIKSNSFKSTLIFKIQPKNLSIHKQIENLNVGSLIKEVLKDRMDRLILFHIDLMDVQIICEENKDSLTEIQLAGIFNDVLKSKIEKSFKGKMRKSIENYIVSLNAKPQKKRKIVAQREEIKPDWFDAEKEAAAAADVEISMEDNFDIEELKRKNAEMLQELINSRPKQV